METNKKGFDLKKFIITLVVFTVCMFLTGFFSAKAFAATIEPLADISQYTTAEMPLGIYYVDDNSDGLGVGYDYHYITVSSVPLSAKWGVNGPNLLGLKTYNQGASYMLRTYKATAYKGAISGSWTQQGADVNGTTTYVIAQNIKTILKSNYNVPTTGDEGVIFFTPLGGLAKLVQPLNLASVQAQLLLLLPLLIPLVVGFLGLRKGLATLRTMLNKG